MHKKHFKNSLTYKSNFQQLLLLSQGLSLLMQKYFYASKLIAMISSADDSMNFECLESVVVPVAGRFPASDRWLGAGEGRAATSLDTGAPLFSSRPPHCLRSVWSRPPPQHQFQQSCLHLCRGRGQRWQGVVPSIPPGALLPHLRGETIASSPGLLPSENRDKSVKPEQRGGYCRNVVTKNCGWFQTPSRIVSHTLL